MTKPWKIVKPSVFLRSMKAGDVGLTRSKTMFAKLQNFYRKRRKESDILASHGFYIHNPPLISEADGWKVSGKESVSRYFGADGRKTWIFRYRNLGVGQLQRMTSFVDGAQTSGGVYSWGGIKELALSLLGKRMKDRRGVFCTEYVSGIINTGGLPYITEKEEWEITPSYQLHWFVEKGEAFGWKMIGRIEDGMFLLPL